MINQQLIDAILDGLEEGLEGSLNQIAGRARELAPVRRLFKGGHRKRLTGPIGVHNLETFSGAFAQGTHRGLRITGLGIKSKFGQGRVNSAVPVSGRIKSLGGARITGVEGESLREVRGREFARKRASVRISGKIRTVDLSQAFLKRAIAEVKLGRGLHSNSGVTEYGGTLRDSIKVMGIRRTPSGVAGYVQASAKRPATDNSPEFDYAYAQEFGTAHNPAQPFLRPALRQNFDRISRVQAMSVKKRLALNAGRTRPRTFGTTTIKLAATVSTTGVDRLTTQLDRLAAVR